jgi:glycosyltransferase involved in cell wall biosynthesis
MSEPIRVLMVNYKMQCAGIEAFIMNMYRNIDRSKIQFDFLVHYKQRQFYDDEIERMGGKIYRLSIREDNNFIKYLKDLKNFFAEHPEYKIVHGHMESFGVFYLRAAKKAGVPVRIAHSHIAQRNKGMKGYIKNCLNRMYKMYATDLFACSDVAGKFLFGKKLKYSVYNNAIDVEKFLFNLETRKRIRGEMKISDDVYVIGHVGRFDMQKNHAFLIDVFNKVYQKNSKTMLLLIGEGELENEIKKKVINLGLTDCVRFMGVCRNVNELYQAMDLFILPSLFEGLPVSAIEAQAAGLKCIFSDNVTRQTTITDNTEYFSLKLPIDDWASEILKWNSGYKRKDTSDSIKATGYDIKTQAEMLQQYYLHSLKG